MRKNWAAALAVVFGVLAGWKVFEFDLFWLVRAGHEILSNGRIQTVDSWSFTAAGKPWLNFQWLSTVVLAAFDSLAAGYRAFPLLRGALVASWTFALLRLAFPGEPKLDRVLTASALAPWLFVMCGFRFQMRPDLFGAVFFAGLLTLLCAGLPSRRRNALSLALLVLWANFHAGTVPVGIAVFCSRVLLERPGARFRERSAWILAAGLAWFATPFGWGVLDVIRENVIAYDYSSTGNPDLQPFSLRLLRFQEGGWAVRLWVLYTAAFVPAYWLALKRRPEAIPGIYREPVWVGATGLVLTALTFSKLRSIHYQAAFLFPAFAGALVPAVAAWPLAAVPVLATLWLWVLPDQVRYVNKPLGIGVVESEIPVRSVAFLKTLHARGNLLNAYGFGGYLIRELPELPVALDGRERPFREFQLALGLAKTGPDAYAAFLRQWNINVVLDTTPGTTYAPGTGFQDRSRIFHPKESWALVYFDNVSVLYLRRIPEHAAAIGEHELHSLSRGLPANFGSESAGVSDELRRSIRAEAERCLRGSPWNAFCRTVVAGYLLKDGKPEAARDELALAEREVPNQAETLYQLSVVYEKLGQYAESRETRARFERLTTSAQPGESR